MCCSLTVHTRKRINPGFVHLSTRVKLNSRARHWFGVVTNTVCHPKMKGDGMLIIKGDTVPISVKLKVFTVTHTHFTTSNDWETSFAVNGRNRPYVTPNSRFSFPLPPPSPNTHHHLENTGKSLDIGYRKKTIILRSNHSLCSEGNWCLEMRMSSKQVSNCLSHQTKGLENTHTHMKREKNERKKRGGGR